MSLDLVTASFNFVAGLFILNNCRVLWNQKLVRGVSVVSTAFFFIWGCWNVVYYPGLGQIWSFRAGLFEMFSNCLWIALMVYFKYREQKQ